MSYQITPQVNNLKEQNLDRLEDICLEYNYVLLDTSALHSMDRFRLPKSVKGHFFITKRMENYHDQRKLLDFLMDSISHYGADSVFYFNPLVFWEIERSNDTYFHYKKMIRKTGRMDKYGKWRLFRLIEDTSRRRRRFIELCRKNNRVVNLNSVENSLFDSFSAYFSRFKNQFDLTDADFEFLMYGAVLSNSRNPTALISNDIKILHSWTRVLRKLKIPPRVLGFFIRKNFPFLERAFFEYPT